MKRVCLSLFLFLVAFPLLACAKTFSDDLVPHYGLLSSEMKQLVDIIYEAADAHQTTIDLPANTLYDDVSSAVSFVVAQYP